MLPFITFEGGEGSGKTTLVASLQQSLRDLGYKVLVTREPGGCRLGQAIRELLLHGKTPLCAKAELLLFLADRAQHVTEVVIPHLNKGYVVLCDRYHDSSYAYQGAARHLDVTDLDFLCPFASTLVPALTLLLDIDPVVGMQRQNSQDRLEAQHIDFHQKVRQEYLKLAKKHARIVVLDATASKSVLSKTALGHILDKLPLWQMQ